jgi:hypothetical protein
MDGRLVRCAAAMALTAAAFGQATNPPMPERKRERPAAIEDLYYMHVETDGDWVSDVVYPPGRHYRGCTNTSSHTDADFTGGSYVVQAGFAQGEVAAASYVLTPDQFPVKVDLMEMIFATVDAIETTTTEWSVLVWDGPPDGTPDYEFSSDGEILPHIVLPPGTNGINVQVSVDPNDPEQIILTNDAGTNTISFGYRIDKHNFQVQDPCFVPPPSNRNCFPTTDVSGLQSGSGNWLRGINCGPFGCPPNGGWARFNQLSGGCRPSGDWVMRMTWTSLNCSGGAGACCLTDGSCIETDAANCAAAGGSYQGDGTTCADTSCEEETQACCFEQTGGCLNLKPSDCLAAGGVPGGAGTQCATHVCFPTGAACMPDGTCIDGVTPDEAQAMGATYMGDGTVCQDITCPDPVGAACFPNGFCLVLTEAEAQQAGATWMGPGTDCADGNSNGKADACEPCDADTNGDGTVDTRDVITFLNLWAAKDDDADFDDNGTIDTRDVIVFLNEWNAGC